MTIAGFSIFVGALAFIIGFLLLFAPGLLKKINEASTKMIAKLDQLTFSYRIGVGISLLIAAAFLFFMAYYFMKRHY